MLQQNTFTQKPTSFGLNCRTQVILEEICICCTGHTVPPGLVVIQNYPSFIQKRVHITFSADGCVRNFFGFGEGHSSLTFLVSVWW